MNEGMNDGDLVKEKKKYVMHTRDYGRPSEGLDITADNLEGLPEGLRKAFRF
jgi:hypothetical protein